MDDTISNAIKEPDDYLHFKTGVVFVFASIAGIVFLLNCVRKKSVKNCGNGDTDVNSNPRNEDGNKTRTPNDTHILPSQQSPLARQPTYVEFTTEGTKPDTEGTQPKEGPTYANFNVNAASAATKRSGDKLVEERDEGDASEVKQPFVNVDNPTYADHKEQDDKSISHKKLGDKPKSPLKRDPTYANCSYNPPFTLPGNGNHPQNNPGHSCNVQNNHEEGVSKTPSDAEPEYEVALDVDYEVTLDDADYDVALDIDYEVTLDVDDETKRERDSEIYSYPTDA